MFSNPKLVLRVFALSLLFVGCVSTASAAASSAGKWRGDVNQSAATLRAGNYANSLKIIDHVLSDMVEQLGSGGADDEMLATVLTYKALANAGLGKVDDALWYWYIAQEIYAAAAKSDLSSFGAPGEFLKRHPFSIAEPTTRGKVIPARVVKQVLPKFPAGASRFGIAGDLVVQIIIDKNGQPTLPHIVRPLPAPTLSFVALEALRHWQFSPAESNGAPISMAFALTVHYKL
ncbi:MAG TPA: energy transducer TonB [Thermoanaerobaculia bacterium]